MCFLQHPFFIGAIIIILAIAGCKTSGERDELLKATPKGSSIEQVLNFCRSNGLQCNHSDTAGYLDQDTGKEVGVRSVWANLHVEKKNALPIISTTSAYWGFDRDGKLLDIWVWHTSDAP